MNTENLMATVERLVDSHGLVEVLRALAGMCGEKAEHLASNWQDEAFADVWIGCGEAIERAATECDEFYGV